MPQRFLRPGIRNSDHWNSVGFRVQSFYIRILTLVDDFGRYDGRPAVLHGECWSVWNEKHPELAVNPQETAADCCALQREKLAIFYEKDGKKVLQLLQWQERSRSDKSKWPEPPQESAAERCGTLPSSPSPLHPRTSPSPSPSGEVFEQIKAEVGQLFGRPPEHHWSQMELYWLHEACKSPTVIDDWETIKSHYRTHKSKWNRHSVAALLEHWGKELDKARNYDPNRERNHASTDRNANNSNRSTIGQYDGVGKVV